jgi:membrane dipeptidase
VEAQRLSLLLVFLFSCTPPRSGAEASSLHESVLVLDSHVDVLLAETPKRYYAPDGGSRTSLEQLTAGGVDAAVFAIAVGPGPETPEGDAAAKQEADAKLAQVQQLVAAGAGRLALARTADEVERSHRDGRIAVLLGFQNARILGTDLGAFDRFYAAGVRVAALNHAGHNAFSDSSRAQDPNEVERHHGLSELGRAAVRRFNDLGVLIDVSQLSTNALLQTVALSRVPVVATHSDARALVDNPRNLSDAELDAIGAKGGVVQLTPFSAYLHAPTPAERALIGQLRARFSLPPEFQASYDGAFSLPAPERERFIDALVAAQPRATLKDYVDHIDYVVRRIGIEHAGVGSDFNHGAGIDGFDGERDAANVTAELVRRGYTRPQVAAIWGGNFLRILRAAGSGARPAHAPR